MKILLSLLFSVFFVCTIVRAQETKLVIEKKFKQGATLSKSFKALTFFDKNSGELHVTLVDNKLIDRYIIDSNWKIINQFSLTRGVYADLPFERFDNMEITGSSHKEFAIYNKGDKKIEINEIDFLTKKEVHKRELEIGKHESLISFFTTDNIFCLIAANKNNNEINFITNAQNGGILFDTISVKPDAKNKDIPAANLMKDAPLIELEDKSIEKLASPDKIYYFGNSVYLSNDYYDETYITEVNLKSKSIHQKVFKQPDNSINSSFNSFLYNNFVVTGNASDAGLSIAFYNYNDGSLIKKYSSKEKDTIDFKNSPIVYKKDKEITTTKDFIKKALSGGLVFTLEYSGKNQTELKVETYRIEKSGGGGGFSPGMPGGSFQTPGGTVNTPSSPGSFSGYGSGNSSVQRNSYFKCLFQPNTFEHIKDGDDNSKSISELIKAELNEKVNRSVIAIFKKDAYLYLGFYDSKNETYEIKKIGELPEN